ncbi:MAG: hypothetical protein WC516_08125 [Patescibacteria group bacterium]|jgi:hypothetical protein
MTQKFDLTKINLDELEQAVNQMQYAGYKYNRQQFPRWTVDQWAKVFGMDAYLMEIKYQKELNDTK